MKRFLLQTRVSLKIRNHSFGIVLNNLKFYERLWSEFRKNISIFVHTKFSSKKLKPAEEHVNTGNSFNWMELMEQNNVNFSKKHIFFNKARLNIWIAMLRIKESWETIAHNNEQLFASHIKRQWLVLTFRNWGQNCRKKSSSGRNRSGRTWYQHDSTVTLHL